MTEITLMLKETLDDSNMLLYESGECNLEEFCENMNQQRIYWFHNVENLNFLIVRLYDLLVKLLENKVYQSDFKDQNVVFIVNNEMFLEPKIIDYGVCSINNYQKILGLTQ